MKNVFKIINILYQLVATINLFYILFKPEPTMKDIALLVSYAVINTFSIMNKKEVVS